MLNQRRNRHSKQDQECMQFSVIDIVSGIAFHRDTMFKTGLDSLNGDGQQFYQNQQNKQPIITSNH